MNVPACLQCCCCVHPGLWWHESERRGMQHCCMCVLPLSPSCPPPALLARPHAHSCTAQPVTLCSPPSRPCRLGGAFPGTDQRRAAAGGGLHSSHGPHQGLQHGAQRGRDSAGQWRYCQLAGLAQPAGAGAGAMRCRSSSKPALSACLRLPACLQSALAAFGVARATDAGQLTVPNLFYSLALLALPKLYMGDFWPQAVRFKCLEISVALHCSCAVQAAVHVGSFCLAGLGSQRLGCDSSPMILCPSLSLPSPLTQLAHTHSHMHTHPCCRSAQRLSCVFPCAASVPSSPSLNLQSLGTHRLLLLPTVVAPQAVTGRQHSQQTGWAVLPQMHQLQLQHLQNSSKWVESCLQSRLLEPISIGPIVPGRQQPMVQPMAMQLAQQGVALLRCRLRRSMALVPAVVLSSSVTCSSQLPLASWWQLWVLWEQVRAAKGCSR